MIYSSYILEKTEAAITTYLASSSLSGSISNFYASNNSIADKESPAVIVECNSGDEDFLGSGIYHIMTRIYYIYPHEHTGSLSTKNSSYDVFTQVLYDNDNLIANITGSVSNLNIFDIFGKGIGNSIQDNHWVSEHVLEVVASYTA